MASYIRVNLDTSKENYLLEKCIQGDDLLLEAFIFENGVKKNLANHQITINFTKPDGKFVKDNTDITVQDNKISCKLEKDVTRVPGIGKMDITLVDNNNFQNSTFDFKLFIKELVTNGAVASDNVVPIIEELQKKITEAGRVRDETDQLIKQGGAARGSSVFTGGTPPQANIPGNKENDWYINAGTNKFFRRVLNKWAEEGVLPTDIINNLISTSITSALSANQGRVLDLAIKDLEKRASVPEYSIEKIIEQQGNNATQAIQWAFNEACKNGRGRILLDKVYEIDKPIIVERLNENTNTSIEIYGGGTIKKSTAFVGGQLVQIKIGFHDEDNIVFNIIGFDGVDKTVNGVDTFVNLAYNLECTDKTQHNESKFVKFNDCSFNNCYHGVRLSSLSWEFDGCLFEHNNYGVYLDCSANANTFTACSIRRNIVGAKIKQFDATIGTVGNGFYNCTIESNENVGLVSQKSRNTKLIGNYFENNGHKINTQFEHYNNKKVHIWLDDIGGSGQHTIDNFYNSSDFDIVGSFNACTVINPCKIELSLASNTNFISNDIANIRFVGYNNFVSDFYLDGVRYVSTTNTKKLYKKDEIFRNEAIISQEDIKYLINGVSPITETDKAELFKITIPTCNFMFLDVNAVVQGLNGAGNYVSQGVIVGKVAISKALDGVSEKYYAHTDDLKLINCGGVESGEPGQTIKNAFTGGSKVIGTYVAGADGQDGTMTFSVDGLNMEVMGQTGAPTQIYKTIKLKYLEDVII